MNPCPGAADVCTGAPGDSSVARTSDTLSFYAVVRDEKNSENVVVLRVEVTEPAPSWSYFNDVGEWSHYVAKCPDLHDARRMLSMLRSDLVNIGRHPDDPEIILEIWI